MAPEIPSEPQGYTCPDIFTTNSPFYIDDSTHVVAIGSAELSLVPRSEHLWLQSDFYAFQYLFQDLGRSQTWINPCTLQKLLADHGTLYHGNRDAIRRQLYDLSDVEAKELRLPVLYPDEYELMSTFVDTITEASRKARVDGGKLLILAFCPAKLTGYAGRGAGRGGSLMPFEEIVFGNAWFNSLSMDEIRKRIHPNVQTTFVTPSCFTHGWLVERNFHLPDSDMSPGGGSWDAIALSCGSAFVGNAIDRWLGLDYQRPGASPRWDLISQYRYGTLCHDAFAIAGRTTINQDELFSFHTENTEWEALQSDETTALFQELKSRWHRLEMVRPDVTVHDAASVYDAETLEWQHATNTVKNPRLQYAVRQYLSLVPCVGVPRNLRRVDNFLAYCGHVGQAYGPNDKPPPYEFNKCNAWEIISYRVSYARVSDYIIAQLKLPRPLGKVALAFNYFEWAVSVFERHPKVQFDERFPKMTRYILNAVVEDQLFPKHAQGMLYCEAMEYVYVALYENHIADYNTERLRKQLELVLRILRGMTEHVQRHIAQHANGSQYVDFLPTISDEEV